jgi:hypothetical protein
MPESLITLLAILIGLVFFIMSMWRKAQEAMRREAQERKLPGRDVRPTAARPVRAPGAPSFEEMLRQMQEQNKRGQSQTTPETRPQQAAEGKQPTMSEAAPVPRTLEVPQPTARSLEEEVLRRPTRSLEAPAVPARRASAQPRAAMAPGRNDYWSRQSAPQAPEIPAATDVAAKLRNPADLRMTFILAEVLKRRYEY